jgi:hypothetical protein
MSESSAKGSSADRNEVWVEVRGKTYRGTYSVSGGWVEVIGPDGQYKTAQLGDSSAEEVAERLLHELYRRGSGAVDD